MTKLSIVRHYFHTVWQSVRVLHSLQTPQRAQLRVAYDDQFYSTVALVTAYIYSGCVDLYNVLITSRGPLKREIAVREGATNKIRSCGLVRRWNKCVATDCRGQSSLTLTYPTPDSGLT